MTEAAAHEWAAHGITVNAYSPGVVGTPMWQETDRQYAAMTGAAPGETFAGIASNMPLGRPQTPDDVAGLVSYLASPDSDYLTGQTVLMDGGLILGPSL